MSMETLMLDGQRLRESFATMAELLTRQKELVAQGGKIERVLRVHQGGNAMALPRGNPKYPLPHQGANEIARRRRQIAAGKLKASA